MPKVERYIRPNATPSHVYIVECGLFFGVKVYKIGIAADVKARLGTMQGGCPLELKLRHFQEVGAHVAKKIEEAIHERLKDRHLRGEWYGGDYRMIRAAFIRCVNQYTRP